MSCFLLAVCFTCFIIMEFLVLLRQRRKEKEFASQFGNGLHELSFCRRIRRIPLTIFEFQLVGSEATFRKWLRYTYEISDRKSYLKIEEGGRARLVFSPNKKPEAEKVAELHKDAVRVS